MKRDLLDTTKQSALTWNLDGRMVYFLNDQYSSQVPSGGWDLPACSHRTAICLPET